MKTIKMQSIIEGVRTRRDRSLGLSIGTPELSPSEKVLFMELQGLLIELTIKPLDEGEVPEVKVEKELHQKTQGQRLRFALYALWKEGDQSSDFEDFYRNEMERIIETVKGRFEN